VRQVVAHRPANGIDRASELFVAQPVERRFERSQPGIHACPQLVGRGWFLAHKVFSSRAMRLIVLSYDSPTEPVGKESVRGRSPHTSVFAMARFLKAPYSSPITSRPLIPTRMPLVAGSSTRTR
jgi:hypothetical protein